MTIRIEPFETTVSHLGKTYRVKMDPRGIFTLVDKYRGERWRSETLGGLQRQMAHEDAEAAQKRERAKALKAAAETPTPALFEDSLTEVEIRGVDQRNGYTLITATETGERLSVRPDSLYRVLTEAERADFVAARTVYAAIAEEMRIVEPASPYSKDFEVDLIATYAPALDAYLTTFGGRDFGPADTLRRLQDLVKNHLRLQRYPIRVDSGGVIRTAEPGDEDRGLLFADTDTAFAYLAAQDRYREARDTFKALQDKFRLDTSPLA